MDENEWEFWIDVGGTFTDCIARQPDGILRQHKLLSSGVVKGQCEKGSGGSRIVDSLRTNDPVDFWVGWKIRLRDEQGRAGERASVLGFDAAMGELKLDRQLNRVASGTTYELSCHLESPVVGIRYLLGIPLQQEIPPAAVRLGTTKGTNALLTRSGARTALVTTRGFADILEIGYQARPRLFDLAIKKPPQLAELAIEIDERMTHDGQVLGVPNRETVRQQLIALRNQGIESLAICLLHADLWPEHEKLVADIAHEIGFAEVSASHEVAALPKIVARGDTTVVDAYLNPVLREYVADLQEQLPGSQLRLLTSAGGLVAVSNYSGKGFRGKDSILSGPAGGVVGFSRAALAAGFERSIGFDMGGTSTDVSRFDATHNSGHFELEYETEKAGVRLVAPTMAIETVAAGGGSICTFDGVKLVVGPDSAGADPGPACYGQGGPLTVTDVNLFLGRILTERFPFPVDREVVLQRLEELCQEISTAGTDYTPAQLATGFLRIANTKMAAAIRLVTIAKGAHPADHVMVAFGGAAPQHACAVALELGISQILIHPAAGILSAYGIGLADVTRHCLQGISAMLTDNSFATVQTVLNKLTAAAKKELRQEGFAAEQIQSSHSLDLRYQGTDVPLTVAVTAATPNETAIAFHDAHFRRYGYARKERAIEIVAARVEAHGNTNRGLPLSERIQPSPATPIGTTEIHFTNNSCTVPVFDRKSLTPGNAIVGPALIVEAHCTTVVDPGWNAEVLSQGELLISHDATQVKHSEADSSEICDPILLEVFNNLLSSIAEQMGITLRNTASSVNVKERLDYSCAIFSADGRLVSNAPHVPVHLGAMEETVRCVLEDNPQLRPGDVIATNNPYRGGSHLPDITVVTPVHDPQTGKLIFLTASRAHHAEIGGITPGSMPPNSRNLAEEGVLIENFTLVTEGQSRETKSPKTPSLKTLSRETLSRETQSLETQSLETQSRESELHELLSSGPFPSRDPETNLLDIAAQVAANRQGANDLLALRERHTPELVAQYMQHIQDAAETKVRQALARLPAGRHTFEDSLQDAQRNELPVKVAITTHDKRNPFAATIDFAGTAPADTGNLNANRAIVNAAVIYVLRVLIAEDIPLNHGVLKPIEIILPEGLLNPTAGATADETPAVCGGNVETSQRVVDVLLGALGIAGASQGTMNNVLFGDNTFGYYETICGGSGATATAAGASAVQVHMTNTRATDPEILERRYPVRLREFSIRRGSGGAGKLLGGDGIVREIEFLRQVDVSLITQRRHDGPYGMAGGDAGKPGRNSLIRADGNKELLPHIGSFVAQSGDVLRIETPGGGGFGRK